MKHRPTASFLAATLVVAANLTTTAQTWQTVDDFQHTAGFSAVSGAVDTDAAGSLVAVGSGTTGNADERIAIVNVSTDHGATWDTLPGFADPDWFYAHNRAFLGTVDGRLLVSGNARKATWASSDLAWYIRESLDGGITWQTTDDLYAPGVVSGCADLAIHPVNGDVYAGGSSSTLGRVIRRRTAGATEFTTVYSSGANDGGSAWSISFHPDGRVFVAGDGPVSGSHPWIVLRSATGNAGTWQQIDAFKTTEWTQASARASVMTPSGALHVAGWGYSSKTKKRHWIVRSSYDGGTTWSISDSYSLGGSTVELSGMTQDDAGNLYVCGQAADSAGKLWWLVRKGVPGTIRVKQGGKWVNVPTVTWSNSEVYRLANGQPARANGLTVDATGAVFASGRAADTAGVDHWIVRKLTP